MAQGRIANLSIGVSADTSELKPGFNKAEAEAERFRKSLTIKTVAIGTAIGQTLGGAVAQLAQSIPAAFSSIATGLDAFNDLSDATGSSVENLSALEEAARRTGGTFETVESTLLRFNKELGEAGDNASGDAFRALGLDLERLKQIDAAEAMRQTAVALQGVTDVNVRARITTELFGKSVKEAAPFLKDLAEQGRLSATVTTEQAAAAEAYNKAISVFKTETENAARALVSEMIPALTRVISELNDGTEAYGGFLRALSDAPRINPFNNLTENISAAREKIADLQKDIDAANEEASKQSAAEKRWSPMEGRIGKLNEELQLLKQREQFLLKQQQRTLPEASYGNEGGLRTGSSAVRPSGEDPFKAAEATRKAMDEATKASKRAAEADAQRLKAGADYVASLEQQLAGAQQLSNVDQELLDIANGRSKAITFQQQAQALTIAAQLDSIEEQRKADKAALDSAELLRRKQQEIKDEVAGILNSIQTPLEEYEAKMQRVQELHAADKLTLDQLARATETYSKQLVEANASADKSMKDMTEAAKRAEQNIQDALGQQLEDVLGGNFDNIGKSFVQMLNKMMAQALAADLIGALTGKGGGNTNALINGIGNFLSAAFGGGGTNVAGPNAVGVGNLSNASSQPLWQMATGTNYVPKDGPYYLHEGESVQPKKYNPAAGGVGQEPSFDFSGQTINVGAGVSPPEVYEAVKRGNDYVEQRIRRLLAQRRVI
jgi:hypothetical protein